MNKPKIVDLTRTAPSSSTIHFLRAEVPSPLSPFVRVYYNYKGHDEKFALRLDVDKQVFLDDLGNKEDDNFIREAAPKIVDQLSKYHTDVS